MENQIQICFLKQYSTVYDLNYSIYKLTRLTYLVGQFSRASRNVGYWLYLVPYDSYQNLRRSSQHFPRPDRVSFRVVPGDDGLDLVAGDLLDSHVLIQSVANGLDSKHLAGNLKREKKNVTMKQIFPGWYRTSSLLATLFYPGMKVESFLRFALASLESLAFHQASV